MHVSMVQNFLTSNTQTSKGCEVSSFKFCSRDESTIILRESSQDESSVMRLRLERNKKPITNTH